MQRKLLVSALLLLLAFVGARAQTDEQKSLCAVVEQTDGTTTEYMLNELPQITYGSNVVKLATSFTTVELQSSKVARIYMAEKGSAQGIKATKSSQAVAHVDVTPTAVTVTGLEPGSDAALYTADGRCLKATTAASDGTLSLPMPTKSQGVLIVKTKNQSFKIINKQ
ncbi:MAG: hypothetical protein IJ887_14535 [Prevotella sp.]|nr:hypothetical protein [Prevotella sp.]